MSNPVLSHKFGIHKLNVVNVNNMSIINTAMIFTGTVCTSVYHPAEFINSNISIFQYCTLTYAREQIHCAIDNISANNVVIKPPLKYES